MNDVSAKKMLQARAYITVWGEAFLMAEDTDAIQYANWIEIEVGSTQLKIDDLDEAVSEAARLLIQEDAVLSRDTQGELAKRIENKRDLKKKEIDAIVDSPAPVPTGP